MTIEIMRTRLSALTGETDEALLLTFIDMAADKILEKLYPYDPGKKEVPARYHSTQLEIAAFLLNKRGAEGQTVHNENGINRSYGGASIPDSMLKGITPFASTFSTGG